MTRRVVCLLEVADVGTWSAVRAAVNLDGFVRAWRSPLVAEVDPALREQFPALAARGLPPLVKSARRPPATSERAAPPTDGLPARSRELLHRAQRHAVDGRFLESHVSDPEREVEWRRPLLGAGLWAPDPQDARFLLLHRDLPPPPPLAFDPEDALLPRPDDLGAPNPGPLGLLHDAASLAAAVTLVRPRRTLAGALSRADEKRLAAHLGVAGPVEASDRWGRAWRALEALRVVATDVVTREVHVDLGLEEVLEGEARDAVQSLLARLVEPDAHPLLELVRTTLAAAGDQAVDDVVFAELVREQQRTAAFWPWTRGGELVYPHHPELPFDDDGFLRVEGRMIHALLARLERLGVLTTAPGVFAATADGRRWAGTLLGTAPPVWVTGDLEVVVPPDAVSPWERFQLERLSRCLARDQVDRYRLDRSALEVWLRTHELDDALSWLARRAPGLPRSVVDTLRGWARSASRLVWWDGVVDEPVG